MEVRRCNLTALLAATKKREMMLEAMIFDFDGLILDTESTELQSWMELYESFGLQISIESWVKTIGVPNGLVNRYDELQKQVGHQIDIPSMRTKRHKRNDELNYKQTIQPGVVELLRDAKENDIKLAIASSADHNWVDNHLIRLGIIDFFQEIICSDDTQAHKPSPVPYLKALELLNVKNQNAIALEDSPNGIASAKAANLFCIAVPNEITKGLDLSKADKRIETLKDCSLETIKEWMRN